MDLLTKLLFAALLHLAFYVGYPDSGQAGKIYILVSPLLWAGFLIFLNTSTALLRLVSGLAGRLLNLAAFAAMGLALAATLPQADRVTVLEKLQAGRYPSRADMDRGLARLGLKKPAEAALQGAVRELDERAAGAAKQLQKEISK